MALLQKCIFHKFGGVIITTSDVPRIGIAHVIHFQSPYCVISDHTICKPCIWSMGVIFSTIHSLRRHIITLARHEVPSTCWVCFQGHMWSYRLLMGANSTNFIGMHMQDYRRNIILT